MRHKYGSTYIFISHTKHKVFAFEVDFSNSWPEMKKSCVVPIGFLTCKIFRVFIL